MLFKKTTSFLLFLVLAIAVLGCSNNSGGSTASKDAKTPDPAGSKAAVAGKVNLDKKYDIKWYQWGPRDIHPDDAVIKHINEKFNVNIKIERILAKEYLKNLELKIAAGDLPDVFRYPISTGSHIYSQLYEDGFLMNFAEYADKYSLNGLKEYIKRPGTEEFREQNGVFQLPSRKAGVPAVMVVRQDWLDQLNMKKPTTMDEFKVMLKAFKDNKLGGNNTVPATFALGYNPMLGLSVGYTGANDWGKVDGKWMYESVMPQYKSFLQYLRELYQEGLIDREVFTANEAQSKAKFIGGSAGVIMAPSERFAALEKDFQATNKNVKLSLIIPMSKGPAGDFVRVDNSYTEPFVAIKKGRDEDFLARVAAVIDYTHSEEGIKILNYGIEGVHYKMDNGKMVKTELYNRDMIESLGHLTAMTSDYSAAASDVEGALKDNVDHAKKSGIPPAVTALSYGSAKDTVPSIEKKYIEWMINFVTGTKDINASWDQYVKEMNDAGLKKLTAAVEENTKKWSK
jgi:putative aldouronate transport system substrate-binding protein